MNILVTGRYEPDYNRTRILLNGLRARGVSVTESPYERKRDWDPAGFFRQTGHFDLVFLPSFTHRDVRFIKRQLDLPLVFDPLISRYLSKVFDYKKVWPYSPRAWKNFLKDQRAMKAADVVLADTEAHRNYYIRRIGIDPHKIFVVPVGVDTSEYLPSVKPFKRGEVIVGFYGSYIPLHGIHKIIEAAALLKDEKHIRFELVGDGVLRKQAETLVRKLSAANITFTGRVPYQELPQMIDRFDICLGIFGDSAKAKMVIPNKIYHYCARGKPVLTMPSPAIDEIFENNRDIFTTDPSPRAMADAITYLVNHPEKSKEVALQGMKRVRDGFNEDAIAGKFLEAARFACSVATQRMMNAPTLWRVVL